MVVGMMYMRESCMSTLVDCDKCIGINYIVNISIGKNSTYYNRYNIIMICN